MTARFPTDDRSTRMIHEFHLERALRNLRDAAREFHDAWAEGRNPAGEARFLRVELRAADELLGHSTKRKTVAP